MNESSSTIYELSLVGLISLLDRCGDVAWRDSMKHHLDLWRSSGESEIHRGIYGGMGSFNDLVITRFNNHNVEPDQEPWVNTLLMCFQSLALEYSRKPKVLPDESRIMHSLRPERVIIQGWQCLRCGYSEVSPTDIDAYLCGRFLKVKIAACFLAGDVEGIVDSCLKMEFEGLDEARALTASSLEGISASVRPAADWNEPCPKCDEHDKAVYSWEVGKDNKIRPCPDNLPLRKMAQRNHTTKATRAPVLLSVLALSLWIAVAAFLLKWVRAWAAGRLEPGSESTWAALYGFFAVAVLAVAVGIFLTVRAWQGKSTVRWQLFSILLAVFSLWATCGH